MAALCTLRLLHELPALEQGSVACVGFGTPPLGNQQLQTEVLQRGWVQNMHNHVVPGTCDEAGPCFAPALEMNRPDLCPQREGPPIPSAPHVLRVQRTGCHPW